MARRRRAVLVALAVVLAGCGADDIERAQPPRPLRIFHASGLTPVLDAVRGDARREISVELLAEASGSQVACRKLTELGRDADLVMLADARLVATLLAGHCSWRIDFAHDEVVLGVGARAPYASEAEQNWPSVLRRPDVRIARVDENQGPIGYRALLVWKLAEQRGAPGLYDELLAKADRVVDHVTRLTPLLKSGETDYAFVYRSICVARDIRYIELDDAVNLGSGDKDYSSATITYRKLKAGAEETLTVTGAPITWALTVPDRGADVEAAQEFIRLLVVGKAALLAENGFVPLAKPRFYGPEAAFGGFESFCEWAGQLR